MLTWPWQTGSGQYSRTSQFFYQENKSSNHIYPGRYKSTEAQQFPSITLVGAGFAPTNRRLFTIGR